MIYWYTQAKAEWHPTWENCEQTTAANQHVLFLVIYLMGWSPEGAHVTTRLVGNKNHKIPLFQRF